jgi:hypothetical protein
VRLWVLKVKDFILVLSVSLQHPVQHVSSVWLPMQDLLNHIRLISQILNLIPSRPQSPHSHLQPEHSKVGEAELRIEKTLTLALVQPELKSSTRTSWLCKTIFLTEPPIFLVYTIVITTLMKWLKWINRVSTHTHTHTHTHTIQWNSRYIQTLVSPTLMVGKGPM